MSQRLTTRLRHRTRTRTAFRGLAISSALAAVSGSLGGGCASRPTSKVSLRAGMDVSQSQSRAERETLCGLLDEVVSRCLPSGSDLCLWTFDREPRKLFAGPLAKPEELHQVEDELILGPSQSPPRKGRPLPTGTFVAPMLEALLPSIPATNSPQERVGVLLLVDGEDWDRERTHRAATILARRQEIRAIWVAGVLTDGELNFREAVEGSLSPFGDRLIVSGTYDLKQGLEQFEARLKGEK